MKVAAGVLGIVAGIFGAIGGFATVLGGAAVSALGEFGEDGSVVEAGEQAANMGAVAFWISILIIPLGIVAFFKPKACGIMMLIAGVITTIAANYFTGPIAILGGIFGIVGGNQLAAAGASGAAAPTPPPADNPE